MLDTVLNLGLNDESVEGLARATDNERFAWDSYRRFVQMFGNVCRGIPGERYEELIKEAQGEAGVERGHGARRRRAAGADGALQGALRDETGEDFPQDPQEQLTQAIRAVFDSWLGERAVELPPHQPHPGRLGHGGERAADGVRQQGRHARAAASRSRATRSPASPSRPATSCSNAQGEDVVSGVRTPRDIHEMRRLMPEAHAELMEILRTLEAHYKDMQDTEFTVEEGSLYMLQTRNAKRPAQAAVRFAVDAVEEGLLDRARGDRHDRRRTRSTRCCTRPSPATRTSRCWPRACAPRRAPRRARSCSPPTTPSPPPRTAAT